MNQKVVFLDVDGTIVNDKGIIPESTQIAIRKAVENGHKLVVCSGRSLFQLPQMLLDLGFSGMVTAAGAQVIAGGKEIYHAVIDEEHRKFIVDYMEKNNFVYCFQTDAGVVMNKRSEQQILKIMSDMGITEEHLRQLVGEFFIQEDVWNNEKEEKLIYYDAPFGVASLRRVFIALGCAWLIGISFGILIGWNKKCNALFGPIFTAFRAVPPLAWVPLMTIWFGTGEFPKVLIVFIGALMPVVVNTQAGISNVIKEYLDIGTIFHANERQMLFEIAIPSALDAIFAGIRNSTSAGWMVVLAAEMLGGKSGVGFLIVRGMDSGDYPLCLLSMICIGVVGYLLAIVIQLLERIICPWTRKKSA